MGKMKTLQQQIQDEGKNGTCQYEIIYHKNKYCHKLGKIFIDKKDCKNCEYKTEVI